MRLIYPADPACASLYRDLARKHFAGMGISMSISLRFPYNLHSPHTPGFRERGWVRPFWSKFDSIPSRERQMFLVMPHLRRPERVNSSSPKH